MTKPLVVAIVAGEESGDLLGADLVQALRAQTGREVRLVGLGGHNLQALGLSSLFNAGDIALMGLTAVIRDLPRLIRRIGQTAKAIAAAKPDVLVTIDSPDFSLRVARKVRAMAPSVPIVHYVCPSVWAWRSGRAAAMKPHVDRILCLLPFEPAELVRLGGPPGTFVGHRLMGEAGLTAARRAQAARTGDTRGRKTLVVLPGSRRGEVRSLVDVFGGTVDVLKERGHDLRLILPTVPHVADLVSEATVRWSTRPEIVTGPEARWAAFGEADAALAASGTVTLELALAGVPLVSCYRLDWLSRRIAPFVLESWSASLPNLIADRVVVPEIYHEMLRPNILARTIEPLLTPTSARAWQVEGFDEIRRRMTTAMPAGQIAADIVLKVMAQK